MTDALTWLSALFEREPDCGAWIEVRQLGAVRPPLREFLPIVDLERVTARVLVLGRERDVYVGVAPRCRREGGKAAIRRVHVLWVDCDTEHCVDRLARFEPSPTLVVWSGSGGCHAYWRLRDPVPPVLAELANTRLAHALEADPASTDCSRILRPPGSLNFKHSPPAAVVLDRWRGSTHTLDQTVGQLADPPERRAPGEPRVEPRPFASPDADDALLSIEPALYVEALTGRKVGRDGKVACPFHDDRTPRLHAYNTPERGWVCYAGCGGGTIIDFGAKLYGLEARGAGYWAIRRRLAAGLLGSEVAA